MLGVSEVKKMGKNLIPIIAKELGVEINEPFKIVGNGDSLWRFTETNLQFYDNHFQDDWVNVKPQSVATLVLETPEIIKLPFEPKVGEIFWTYWVNWGVTNFKWEDKKANFDFRKFCGCVFRTEEEALRARPAKYKELTGKEWGV
jgi:hypothetical protein